MLLQYRDGGNRRLMRQQIDVTHSPLQTIFSNKVPFHAGTVPSDSLCLMTLKFVELGENNKYHVAEHTPFTVVSIGTMTAAESGVEIERCFLLNGELTKVQNILSSRSYRHVRKCFWCNRRGRLCNRADSNGMSIATSASPALMHFFSENSSCIEFIGP